VPDKPNGATKVELEEGVFMIIHPDGSYNIVGNLDGAHAHVNVGAYNGQSGHWVEQRHFTDDEGIAVRSSYVQNLGPEFIARHTGDHYSTTHEDGTSYRQHNNSNQQGFNMVSIIQVEGEGAQVSHFNMRYEDFF
jgi:hypothetical protein